MLKTDKWNPFKKKQPVKVETKSSSVEIPLSGSSWLAQVLTGDKITASKAMNFYRQNSAVATAVDMIAEIIEQINPVLTVDDRIIDDSPVLDLLKNPNGFETWSDFIGKLSRHYLLTHDSHLAAVGNVRSAPVELWALKPTQISVIEAADTYPKSYLVTEGPVMGNFVRSKSRREFKYLDGNLKEIYHIKGFSSRRNETSADSPLEAAALEARQYIQGKKHNLALLDNGGRLSLIVTFKDAGLNDDELKERSQLIKEKIAGAEKAGGIATISGTEMQIDEVGTSNKDMDYAELERMASNAIYLRYKIPLPLVTLDASTFNNVENAVVFLYETTALPHADFLFASLSKFLLPRFGIDPSEAKITYNPESIKPIMSRRIDELKKRRDINIETINELRSLLPNREPVDGGDSIYQNASLIPVGESSEETEEEELNRLMSQ